MDEEKKYQEQQEQIEQAQREGQRQGRGLLGRGVEFGNKAYGTARRIKKASGWIKSLAKFGAKTGGKTAVKAGATATVEFWGPALAIILVAVIILVFFLGLFILLTSGDQGNQDQKNPPPGFEQIPGLSISFTGTAFVTDANEPIIYNGTVTYSPPASSQIPANSITIFDQIPSNAVYQSATGCTCSDSNCTTLQCPLTGSSMNFQITLKARENNIWVLNKVYATTSYIAQGGSGNACTSPYEGKDYCSVQNLKTYLKDDKKALIASMICQAESESNPGKIFQNCNNFSLDDSVGLFQVDLYYHCDAAKPHASPGSCWYEIPSERDKCAAFYFDPINSINKMIELSNNGQDWSPWQYSWQYKVKPKLSECGIL